MAGIDWYYAEAFQISKVRIKQPGFPKGTDDFFDKNYLQEETHDHGSMKVSWIEREESFSLHLHIEARKCQASYDFTQLDLQNLYDKFHKEDYVFIIKWHPALYNNIAMGKVEDYDYSPYGNFFKDFSEYRDINDLLVVCDTLITDYSSKWSLTMCY